MEGQPSSKHARAEEPSPKPTIGVPMDYTRRLKEVELHGKEKMNVVCTSNPTDTEEMIKKMRMRLGGMIERLVGVNVEFTKGLHPERAAILQLCMEENYLVYHITAATKKPKLLQEFLVDKMYTFVGFCIEGEKAMLKNSGFVINPGEYIDLQRKWGDPYDRKYRDSLADVASLIIHPFYGNMKKKINKEEDLKMWGISPLPNYLIEYAAIDTYATCESWNKVVCITKGSEKEKEEKEHGDDPYAYYDI